MYIYIYKFSWPQSSVTNFVKYQAYWNMLVEIFKDGWKPYSTRQTLTLAHDQADGFSSWAYTSYIFSHSYSKHNQSLK